MQQINLFLLLPKTKKQILTFEVILIVYGFFIFLLFLNYSFELIKKNQLQNQVASLNVLVFQEKNQLERTMIEFPLINPEDLEGSMKKLQDEVSAKIKLMAIISNSVKFSSYLTSFANADITGLWLTQMQITQNGYAIDLKGLATHEDHIHQYYEELKKQSIFAPLKFELLGVSAAQDEKGEPMGVSFMINGRVNSL